MSDLHRYLPPGTDWTEVPHFPQDSKRMREDIFLVTGEVKHRIEQILQDGLSRREHRETLNSVRETTFKKGRREGVLDAHVEMVKARMAGLV